MVSYESGHMNVSTSMAKYDRPVLTYEYLERPFRRIYVFDIFLRISLAFVYGVNCSFLVESLPNIRSLSSVIIHAGMANSLAHWSHVELAGGA